MPYAGRFARAGLIFAEIRSVDYSISGELKAGDFVVTLLFVFLSYALVAQLDRATAF